MKRINYTGSSKLISRIVDLINRKVPMPTDSQDNIDWGTSGQVLITDGAGGTTWGNQISGIDFEVVSVLPTTDISQSTIYLVPKSTAGTNNVYDEYINTTGTAAGWELIGDTTIDLSNYYTKSETDALIPDDLADLNDDSTHRLVTDTEKTTWSAKVGDNPTFTEASTRANIASGESFATILGKIKKFFTDLKAVAFSGSYTDLSDKPTIPADENVKQTATTGNYDFRVLLSATATDGDYTGVVKKNTNLKYNASTGNFQVPKINGVDVGSAPEFTDIKVLYGTCSTAGSVPDKKVVLSGTTLTDAQYSSLPVGIFLCVKFDNTNSASNCTLSIVNNATTPTKYTAPTSIYYNASVYTGSSQFACGYANRHNYYVWDGTYWVWVTRGVETEFSNMSASELVTGTSTNQRTVRADYLNEGIQDLITQNAWATKNTAVITATSESHADLNDYKTPGNYSSASSSVSQYIDNAPTTSAGFNLIVMRIANGDSRLRQIVFVNAGTAIYTRYYSSSSWSSWVNIATTYNALTASALKTGTATTLRTVRADYLNDGIKQIAQERVESSNTAIDVGKSSGYSIMGDLPVYEAFLTKSQAYQYNTDSAMQEQYYVKMPFTSEFGSNRFIIYEADFWLGSLTSATRYKMEPDNISMSMSSGDDEAVITVNFKAINKGTISGALSGHIKFSEYID